MGALVALLAACKADYRCGDYVYSETEGRCVCPPGSMETEDRRCILADGGTLYPPGWDGSVGGDAGTPGTCSDGRPPRELFEDADGDGYGRIGSGEMGCEGTPGRVTRGDDCDDACRDCYPGAVEICDGRDNDCARGPDDTFACVRGAATACQTSCGSTGVVACGLDCAVPAGATCTAPAETCNGADDDCDSIADEGVLSFGEPVEWPSIVELPVIVHTGAGLVSVASAGDAGLVARRYDAGGAEVGPAAMLTSARISPGAYAAAPTPAGIAIAWILEGSLWVAELSEADLSYRAGPRELVTSGIESPIAIVNAGFYTSIIHGSSVAGLVARTVVSLDSSAPTSRTLVASRTTLHRAIAVAASQTTIGRAFVAYADVPAGESDTELFVQILDGGELVGSPTRMTNNDVVDKSPALAVAADGQLGMAWLESPDASELQAHVRARVLAPGATTLTVTHSAPGDLGIAAALFTNQLHLRRTSTGWALAYPALAGDVIEQRMRLLGPSMAAASAEIVPEPITAPLTDLSIALVGDRTGSRLGLVNARGNFDTEEGALRLFWLGCD